jgi:hypothetical protein
MGSKKRRGRPPKWMQQTRENRRPEHPKTKNSEPSMERSLLFNVV